MEWLGDAAIQVGAYDAPPPAQLGPFLAGFVDGLTAHDAVREAKVLDVDAVSLGHRRNPTRRVSFRFIADSYAKAELLATDELRGSAIRAGVETLDPSLRHIEWMVSIGVAPA